MTAPLHRTRSRCFRCHCRRHRRSLCLASGGNAARGAAVGAETRAALLRSSFGRCRRRHCLTPGGDAVARGPTLDAESVGTAAAAFGAWQRAATPSAALPIPLEVRPPPPPLVRGNGRGGKRSRCWCRCRCGGRRHPPFERGTAWPRRTKLDCFRCRCWRGSLLWCLEPGDDTASCCAVAAEGAATASAAVSTRRREVTSQQPLLKR